MSEETHPGEAQTFVGTPDYMEKARELADSYPQLLARKQELKRQIDESHAWFYTRDEVIYKLSQGAHEQGERVKTSGTSNPVERTVLNCDKVLASMNREIQKRREEELKSDCRFCVWKFEKRSGQKTKMPYNPANGDRARINDLRTFADFKTTLMTYAMGGYDGIGIAVGNGIGAFDIDHCIREDGTLNDTAATVLSIFPTAYVEKSPSGKGLRGFFGVPEDFVYDKTVYYINNRSKGLEVYMPGATNRFVTVTGDVYRTGEIPNDETAMTTLLDSLMKRNKQVQNTQLRHHSYLDDDAVIAHAEEASNGDKFKKLYAGDWEELYDSQSDADMALLSNADKQKIENEAAIAKAEADKQVAITNAEAEAQKTSIAADAQAEANRKIAESLSDTLIEYQKIQKWDGKLPTVSGSNALVSIDPAE